MKARMSPLVEYLLSNRDQTIRKQFSDQMRTRFKDFYKNGNNIHPSKDNQGNKITNNHPYKELSDAILDFHKGKNAKDLPENPSKHFCAGYINKPLSKIILHPLNYLKIKSYSK